MIIDGDAVRSIKCVHLIKPLMSRRVDCPGKTGNTVLDLLTMAVTCPCPYIVQKTQALYSYMSDTIKHISTSGKKDNSEQHRCNNTCNNVTVISEKEKYACIYDNCITCDS